jgi:hypothetical protein
LDQPIATRYQPAPMALPESAQYLRHHLAQVGRPDPFFADAAATARKALVDDECAKRAVAEFTRD